MTKVTVVTISFNQVAYLERAIRSVLSQDYPAVEYIIVDAGSTDGSRAVIERYRERLAQVILETDQGPADGLNKGFARASGEICGYLNADDEYLPSAVSRAVQAFEQHPAASAVYAHGHIIDAKGQSIRRFRSTRFSPWRYVHGGAGVMQQATFFRRRAWEEVGGFNRDSKLIWDVELLIDFVLAGMELHLVNDQWGLFRVHQATITNALWNPDGSLRSRELEALLLEDRRRIHRKVLGRDPGVVDYVLRPAARLQKWLVDPLGFMMRAGEILHRAGKTSFPSRANRSDK